MGTALEDPVIVAVEWAQLTGRRPRHAGSNARLGDHGSMVRPPIARVTTADGHQGFGYSRAHQGQAQSILGRPLSELFTLPEGTAEYSQAFDFPLWDLAGRRAGSPVYRLLAPGRDGAEGDPFQVPCYDTTLYFDDLHLDSTQDAAELLAREAEEGLAQGHRAFKIKVGRGARHLPLAEGTRRDIEIVRAVRAAVGPDTPLMLDANNGYNLNLAKQVLLETADCGIYWLEEAFHEDAVLYRDLKEWLDRQGLQVFIADGEGQASPSLLAWAQEGLVDVIQYDIFGYGFTPWLQLGRRLDGWGIRSAPHHYGGHYGNFAAPHLAAAIAGFAFVEWDPAATPGLVDAAYGIREGRVQVPEEPGFGLQLDEDRFLQAVAENGYRVTL